MGIISCTFTDWLPVHSLCMELKLGKRLFLRRKENRRTQRKARAAWTRLHLLINDDRGAIRT